MKHSLTGVIVLLLAGLLVSCGGDGGTSDGASPGSSSGANPPGGGSPPTGGNPGSDSGGGPAPLPSAGAHVEESDAAVTLSPGWTPSDSGFGWSGGGAMQSTVDGALASFTFTGTSVTWIGSRGREHGTAIVKVDGGRTRGVDFFEVDLHATPNDEIRTPVLTIGGLSNGPHTLTIEVKRRPDGDGHVVVVDAFDVQAPTISHLQEADPDVTFIGDWAEAGSALKWSGGDAANAPETPITAKVTATAGATATLAFRGTGIRWIGYRGPDAGIALVSVDGGTPTPVDLYSPGIKVQEVVFTATGLADAKHTLKIEVTGQKNAAATAAKVFVDAFDVMTPGRRYQENFVPKTAADPSITYVGEWIRNTARIWSEGRAVKALGGTGASVTFSFTGTSVSWIGCAKSSLGRARIFLDGAFVKEVNTRRLPQIEGYQRTIFRADGLTKGPHTLTIVPVSGLTVIDAFDLNP